MSANIMSCSSSLLVQVAGQQHPSNAKKMAQREVINVQPIRYKLNLKLDPDDDAFSGDVQIQF